MQQEFGEYLGWGLVSKAFSWGIVAEVGDVSDLLMGAEADIGFSRQVSAQSSIGIFDAALFPGAMGIAKVGFDAELIAQFVVQSELGSVVLGERSAQLVR